MPENRIYLPGGWRNFMKTQRKTDRLNWQIGTKLTGKKESGPQALGSGPIDQSGSLCFTLAKREVSMSGLIWLSDEQMARIAPYVPKSHGGRGSMTGGLIYIIRNGLQWSEGGSRHRSE